MVKPTTFMLLLSLLLASCLPGAASDAPERATVTMTASTPTPLPSETPTPTFTPTPTDTPLPTAAATETSTPEPSATPTSAFPTVTVNQQAHCRYGPSVAYLHAADLYAGDTGTVQGRYQYSKWLMVKFDKLKYYCWVAPSVVDVVGDTSIIFYAPVSLPGPSALYKAPQNVTATRDGDKVTISWEQVSMTKDDDRGYFLELFVCQDGRYLWWTFSYPDQFNTSYTVRDEPGCPAPSNGQLYTVEKHGYSKPVTFPWP